MKKLLIILLLLPSLSFAAPYHPWETVQAPHIGTTIERMSVPHGWLVITYGEGATTIFVPDENHEWVLEK